MIICIECNAALIEEGRGPEDLFSQEGHTGVISLVKNDNGIVELKNNSLNEAMLPLSRARGEILLGLLPSVFLPDAKSSLLIGYGAGTTASVLAATPLESIKVVELEPAVVKAMQTLQGETIPQLQDPRLSIIYNDARNVLQLEKQRYDIVISQPSHPWRNGASQLFTSEFFETVSSRLSEKGTFVQWINLFHMDIPTLKSLVASFYHVFPKGAVFVHRSPEQLFLLGSKEPLILDRTSVDKVFQRPAMNKILRQANMHNANRLLHYFLFTRKEALEMAGDAEHVTDLNLLPEVRLGHADFETNSIEIYNLLQKHALSLQGNVSSN
jgi:spermidine synthase